jgi:hypothetical protein
MIAGKGLELAIRIGEDEFMYLGLVPGPVCARAPRSSVIPLGDRLLKKAHVQEIGA